MTRRRTIVKNRKAAPDPNGHLTRRQRHERLTAELGDPEEFARRLRRPLLGHITDALETQSDLGATDDVGF